MKTNSKNTGQSLLCRAAQETENHSLPRAQGLTLSVSQGWHLDRGWNSSYSGWVGGTHSFITMARSAEGHASLPKAQGGLAVHVASPQLWGRSDLPWPGCCAKQGTRQSSGQAFLQRSLGQ